MITPARLSRKHASGPHRVAHLVVAAITLFQASAYSLQQKDHRTYPGESISWHPCGKSGDHDLECSDIDVPIDQFEQHRSSNKTFNIPLVRARGKNATQHVLVNPGGPGGSGMAFVYGSVDQLLEVVGEGYHILGFDPRGVNSSRPVASCYPDDDARKANSEEGSSSALKYAQAQNMVKACAQNMGKHAKYINTPQTAADMNSILDAVGQKDLAFMGVSYGSILGQTYAALFPERSHRIVISAVSDLFAWYGTALESDLADNQDAPRVLEGFFDECIKAGDKCALSSRARSKEALQNKTVNMLNRLKQEPIPVYLNETLYGVLNDTVWQSGVWPQLYYPDWRTFADALAAMMDGNATDAFLNLGLGESLDLKADESATFVSANDGKANDGTTGPTSLSTSEGIQAIDKMFSTFAGKISPLTPGSVNYYTRQLWPTPKSHNFVPRKGVKTAHPLLVVSGTYDPATAIGGAKKALETFEGSRLVEIKGYGHGQMGNCGFKHVQAFFKNGTLPEKDVQCEAGQSYFAPLPKE